MAKTLWLSHLMSGASLLVVPLTTFCSFISHRASLDASEQAMYSASRVDEATKSCFRDCHEMEPQPFRPKMYVSAFVTLGPLTHRDSLGVDDDLRSPRAESMKGERG